uniref:Uncharacterized protein n=1 Tax=Thermosporothrix sp. COM3 TaxID=2490863 RepID=A0A455SMS3_9CHLR|nr:hypothetical protein KTC_22560 [Thermosporothrix sp. COM3]
MEQRHYQYRRREPFSEERFIIRDHGKIQEKRSITHIVLNVLFCAILFTVSFIGRPYARFDADGCGNSVPERFFLCDALGHGGKHSRWQEVPVLLSPFSPHMIFLFACVVLFSMHGNELMPILVAWLVVLPVYVALYCLVRYVR